MRLVRGSIMYSKPCSITRAIEMLQVFLATDAGADVSVKSFLKSAATALESMRDDERSSHRKSKRKKRRLDHENSPSISAPKDETLGPSSAERDPQLRGKHSKKRRKGSPTEDSEKNHRVKEDGGSVKADVQEKQENLISDLETTPAGHTSSRKMRGNDEINAGVVGPATWEAKREVSDEGEGVPERRRRKGDRKHSSRERADLLSEFQVEAGQKAEMRVKQEKQASDSANTSVEQMNSRKMREKQVMNTPNVSSVSREPKREVSDDEEEEGVTQKRRKKDGKHSGKEQADGLQEMRLKQEMLVSELDNAYAEQMYLIKMRGGNVVSTDVVSPATREPKREAGDEQEGITEKRREKDRKHLSKEQVGDLQRNLPMEGGKTEFELKGALGTWKKQRKAGFPNGVVLSGRGQEVPIDTDVGFPIKIKEEENNLAVFSSKKAEKVGVLISRPEQGTNSHLSKEKRKERAGNIEVDEMEQHSKKKRSRSQT